MTDTTAATSRSAVLVVGGGPAGSTAASLLARSGVDVALFEREVFPRYHIGESVLPAAHPVLDLIGAKEKIARHGFRRKAGQYLHWGNEVWEYRFGALSGTQVYTWQVERAEFDEILLRHAAEQGARVHEGRRVTEVHFDGARPCAVSWLDESTGATGRHEFDQLIDASGRAGLLVNRYLGGRTMNESFRNVALWGYWDGAHELPHAPEGATIASSIKDGWVWAIPLRSGASVGVVMHKRRLAELREAGASLEEVYHGMLGEAGEIPVILDGAKFRGEIKVEQDYSYRCERFSGPGYFVSGDSACFLDPLFSSGIHLAMFSALLASASILALRRGELDEDTVARFYHDSYERTYLRFLVIVAAVYKQYDGAQSYFWQAKDLLRDGYRIPEDVALAFLHVVSGDADMADITDEELTRRAVDRAAEFFHETHKELQDKARLTTLSDAEREQIRARAAYWNATARCFSLSPDTAVGGLYVETTPRLGLRRAAVEAVKS